MKLDGHSLAAESDDDFEIKAPDGGTFRVAKKALRHSTVEAIRKHFADGGPVAAADSGGLLGNILAGLGLRDLPLAGTMVPDLTAPPAPPEESPPDGGMLAGLARTGIMRALPGGAPNIAPAEVPTDAVPAPVPIPAPVPRETPAPLPAQAAPAPASGGGGAAGAMQAGARAEQQAALGLAGMQAKAAQEQARAVEEQERTRQAQEQAFAGVVAQRNAKLDQDFAAIMAAKVDPRASWERRDGMGKATAVIGLLLSGMGAGLTRGTNMAMKVLDDEIDRDIDAQKANIAKGANLLSHYMAQTQNLQSAQALTRASLLTGFAAQLQAQALKSSAPQVQQQALVHVAKLRQDAALNVQRATLGDMQLAEYRKQQAQQAQVAAMLSGGNLREQDLEKLPEKLRERMVRIGGGRIVPAIDKENAAKAQAVIAQADGAVGAIRRAREMLKEDPTGVLAPNKVATADSLYSQLVLSVKNLGELGVLSAGDMTLIERMVPNASGMLAVPGSREAKLDQLDKMLAGKVGAALKSYTGALK